MTTNKPKNTDQDLLELGAKAAGIKLNSLDRFYIENGKCCAGCDWWRFHNSVIGDCTKSAPVSGEERGSMAGIRPSIRVESGHIMTPRDHVCGDFKDDFDWASIGVTIKRGEP